MKMEDFLPSSISIMCEKSKYALIITSVQKGFAKLKL